MGSPTENNFDLWQGNSYRFIVELQDDDGTPLNPAGKLVRYRITHYPGADEYLVQLTEADMVFSSEGAPVTAYLAEVLLTSALTTPLNRKRYYHEMYVVDGTEKYTQFYGEINMAHAQAAHHS